MSDSRQAAVSAPGKAFLIGEYAVLEGAPALVAAVNVRAVAHATPEPPAQLTAVVRCAHARVRTYLEARGADPVGAPPVIETGGFTMGHRKLGLGSSAAVTASVVGYHLAAAGLDPRDPEIRADALGLALAAHAEAQGGGGSGADVAAAIHGGVVRFVDRKSSPVAAPTWLRTGFVDAGAPAVTSSFVAAVREGAKLHPRDYQLAMEELRAAGRGFEEAYLAEGEDDLDNRFAAILEATRRHCEGLRRLQALSGAPIMTDAIEAIVSEAAAAGVAAKPSGAGGGDLVVLFSHRPGEIDRLGETLRHKHDRVLLSELKVDGRGLEPDARMPTNSRLAGFFKLSVEDRRGAVATSTGLNPDQFQDFDAGSLDVARANHMIENVVGTLELPLAIATNFRINGKDVLVPMAVEEASVVAAASNAAKMIRAGGGFVAHSDPPWMIAQVQLSAPEDGTGRPAAEAAQIVESLREELLALADGAHPRLVQRGGGARGVEVRVLSDDMLAVHVLVDCQDAMGANLLNTVAETAAPVLEKATGWVAGLRILSNLADRRCAHISARIPPDALAGKGRDGDAVVRGIVSASKFAELDPYRATTHNKGIMNGVDAVVLATGNDWRAMESSAHAYAAKDGQYRPLAVWRRGEDGWLEGQMTLPAAVGVVGGATRVHPVARLALQILGCQTGAELGQVMAAAGLASNLAALRALATEGIQRGHMSLHARSIALEVGANGSEVEQLARRLVEDGEIKADRAASLLRDIRAENR